MEKSSETGQGQKSLVSIFAWFLTAMAKIWYLQGRLGAGLSVQTILDFSNIS